VQNRKPCGAHYTRIAGVLNIGSFQMNSPWSKRSVEGSNRQNSNLNLSTSSVALLEIAPIIYDGAKGRIYISRLR
jgi:hypothetical protein